MDFAEGHIYHVLNRGNNSQPVFFNRENYLFFLDKIRKNILPHADILAWCLMPNHFHLMIEVVNERIAMTTDPLIVQITDPMTSSHRISCFRVLQFLIANENGDWKSPHPMKKPLSIQKAAF